MTLSIMDFGCVRKWSNCLEYIVTIRSRSVYGRNKTLQWRHNERDGVSNHQPHDCLFRRRSQKITKLRVTGLCAGNSPETDEFLAQMASNAENVSIWWLHHEKWANQFCTLWDRLYMDCRNITISVILDIAANIPSMLITVYWPEMISIIVLRFALWNMIDLFLRCFIVVISC